ncbi:MAG: hypothetical protein ACRC28_06460 [Clostridium sp.]|uniref:hypothetical protein n=1 Tax=Clostridium sp. TaxID=1506 RepID=UPI003F2E602A
MNCFKRLKIKEDTNLEKLREAYYKEIYNHPPEIDEKAYIEINKAYKEALEIIEKRKGNYVKLVEEISDFKKEENRKQLESLILNIINEVNLKNFKEKNEDILKIIEVLNKRDMKLEIIFLIESMCYKLEKMELKGLEEAYRNLKKNVMEKVYGDR